MTIHMMIPPLIFYLENAFQDIPNSQQILTLMILINPNLNKALIILMTAMIRQIMNSLKFLRTIHVLPWNNFKIQKTATESLIKFMKLVLTEIGGEDFDDFPKSIYLARNMLGLKDQFQL